MALDDHTCEPRWPAARRGSPSRCRRRGCARPPRSSAARACGRRRAAGRSSGRRRSAAARCPTPRRRAPRGRTGRAGRRASPPARARRRRASRSWSISRSGRASRRSRRRRRGPRPARARSHPARPRRRAPRGVDRDLEARAQRVERGVLDAVVGGQADDRDLRDPALAQQLLEVGALEAAVAVGVDAWPLSTITSIRVRSRSGCSCAPASRRRSARATVRPARRRRVVGGMPVAGGDDEVVVAGGGERVDLAAIASPSGTASAPPGVKSFWKSTMTSALATRPGT